MAGSEVRRPKPSRPPCRLAHGAIAALERGEITRADIVESPADAVQMFRDFIFPFDADLSELRGKDLACWCALDQPCHADVLLEWANAPGGAE